MASKVSYPIPAPIPVNDTRVIRLGKLDNFIGFRMRRVQNQLSRDFASATAEQGLRSGLFSSLAIIAANPGLSQSELSQAVGMDKSVTVTLVDELEARNWALRRRSTTDRRRYALTITEEGAKQLDNLFAQIARTEAAMLQELSPGEHILLNELLDRLYATAQSAMQ